jgi:hypothetical protein
LVDGITTDEPVKDYWGLVGRLAARIPRETQGMRVRLASELGFAPITPTRDAVGLAGTGDASGLAWNIAVSLIDWMPKHSIGVNYGRTGAGWLLSPQYRANEELFEVRYVIKPKENLTIEMRARWRRDLEMLARALDRRNDFDIYARMTWRFNGRRFAPFWQ